MNQAVTEYLKSVSIGEKQSYKNLALFPLIGPDIALTDYLLLDDALKEHLIEVTELTQGGSVPELKVTNSSEKTVLLLDGEELVGAKQNRILNTTILVAGKTVVVIPVSCVEQGRWSYRSSVFCSEERVMPPSMRSSKATQVNYSLRHRGDFHSDQGAIWNDIQGKASRRDAPSPSMAMSEIYNKDRGSLEEYRKHFTPADNQVGALFLINGNVVGLDSFGKRSTFAKVFAKLLDSYALDAIDWLDPDRKKDEHNQDAQGFIAAVSSAQEEARRAVSLGTDIRFETPGLIGFALEYEQSILHLSAFAKAGEAGREDVSSRMQSFSRRRRNRE